MIPILASNADAIARDNITLYVCLTVLLIVAMICFTFLVIRVGPPKIWFDGHNDKNKEPADENL